MTVYIDNAFVPATVGRHTSRWCHLTADSHDELMDFATNKLRLLPQHLQAAGTRREHFDLTEPKRELAIKLGARAITVEEAARMRAARITAAAGTSIAGAGTLEPAVRSQATTATLPPPMEPTQAEHIAARDAAAKHPSAPQVVETLLTTITGLRRAVAMSRARSSAPNQGGIQ